MSRVIPCIDVMGGKVVQLVQGERKALELDSEDTAIEMFRRFGLLHVIDLDAALGKGENHRLIERILGRVKARVGGGVRSVEAARALIELGAHQVIVGTRAFSAGGIDEGFLRSLVEEVGRERVALAIDVKKGKIAVKGWQETLDLSPGSAMGMLEPYCEAFLCTNVDREGMLGGTDVALFLDLRGRTERTLIAAGGITTLEEVIALTEADIQVALGMAVYTGALSLERLAEIDGA